MPLPLLQGRCIVEIAVPQTTVCKNDCERCGRVWYSDSEAPTAKVIVRMIDEKGATIVNASYDVICEGCTQTVGNLLKALAREMKKLGSSKPRAKKEGAEAPSEPEGSAPASSPAPASPSPSLMASTPPTDVPRQLPSGPSRQR